MLAVLATNRRRVQPTAIGRTPPSFLLRAVSEAPKRNGRISTWTSPVSTKLVKVVSSRSSNSPPSLSRPAGHVHQVLWPKAVRPPAEPLGKDRIAWDTSLSLTSKAASNASSLGADGRLVSGWAAGCLDLRAPMVALLTSAMLSPEQARRTAPLKSPSSNLAETLLATNWSASGLSWC